VDHFDSLRRAAWTRLAWFIAILLALIFVPARRLDYWQGWLFWAVFSSSVCLITGYLLRHDPALVARRLHAGPSAEKAVPQKIIQALAMICFAALVILPAVDHRFGWSHLPVFLVLAGDALILLGMYIVFLVLRANSYASSVIELAEGQRVITTGPYRFVRHPMYAGALLMLLGIPLALGSAWVLMLWVPLAAVLIWRLIEEEKFLAASLAGYSDYCSATPYRLIPGIY
jgi:protein-S-isoprenylcysteine O-methyltransferase Ste14